MRRIARLLLGLGGLGLVAGLGACTNEIYDTLLHPPAVAGGEVTVALDGGRPAVTTALAMAAAEPMQVSGFSGELVVGMRLGSTALGNSARALLTGPGTQADLAISAGGVTQLQVHVGGKSCVAETGLISLEVQDDHKLHGTFTADGAFQDGSGACKLDGTLKAIPIKRE